MEKEDVSPETLIQVPNMLALFDTDIYQRLMEVKDTPKKESLAVV
jgi:hypothetical protein